MNHLQLFNGIIKQVRPVNASEAKATDLEQSLKDTGLDSLDLLMTGIYLADIYGVSEEVAKLGKYETVGQMIDYFIQNKTKTPDSLEQALESIK